jgi:hypothetical protein
MSFPSLLQNMFLQAVDAARVGETEPTQLRTYFFGIVVIGVILGRIAANDPAVYFCRHGRSPYADAISARMSSTRHTVTRGPNFTGFGKRPVLTPSHQQDFLTGIIGGIGGSALGLPIICGNRRKPVSGSRFIRDTP